jgi:glycosyltransferase involved in cell wall biosynthesis
MQRLPVFVLAMSRHETGHAYELVGELEGVQQHAIFGNCNPDELPARNILRAIDRALSQVHPRAVVSHGWGVRSALTLDLWAFARRIPLVVMSDSTERDASRTWLAEKVKTRIVSRCAAAFVSGSSAARYVEKLGMSPDRVFPGCDVVDNRHFERGALAARANRDLMRQRLAAPARFFLACARFIEKKNLFRMMEAYARYRLFAGPEAWSLVVVGDGPLRPQLEEHRENLGMNECVLMPGCKSYDELPAWYGLASAFVHASTTEQWGLVVNEAMAAGLPVLVSERCGCVPDLVRPGVNGFAFDPYDVAQLAELMLKVSSGGCDRNAMGRAGQEFIRDWGPERFADGLVGAVEMAISAPAPMTSHLDRLLLRALMRR